MTLDTRFLALLLGVTPGTVIERARRLGLGERDTARPHHAWTYTRAEVEQLMDAYCRPPQPRCPRCTILTPRGEMCDECQWEIEHDGQYQVVDELTGEVV